MGPIHNNFLGSNGQVCPSVGYSSSLALWSELLWHQARLDSPGRVVSTKFELHLYLRPKRLPERFRFNLADIGARSRLMYVTGCKQPLTLGPSQMNSVSGTGLTLLLLVCRHFHPTCNGAVDRSFPFVRLSGNELVVLQQSDYSRLALFNLDLRRFTYSETSFQISISI